MMATVTRNWIVLLACAWITGCGGETGAPEDAVRKWVSNGHAAAEAKDRGVLVDMISPAYTDSRGNGRDEIENMFRIYFLRQHKVALLTRITNIEVIGESAAELILDVGMAATNDGVLGFNADAYTFDMELEKDGDDWLLISARWGEMGEELH